jgi:hypothetical protein
MGRPVTVTLTPCELAIKKLSHKLRDASKRGVKDRLRIVESIPFNTKLKFDGVPLTTIMCPTVPEDGAATEAIFDAFLYSQKIGEGDAMKDLMEVSTPDMVSFVKGATELGDQCVRLLWALGQAPNAHLTYDKENIVVEHDDRRYGIVNGVVKSRFCSGLAVRCQPKAYLENRQSIKVVNPHFTALWVEARSKGRGADKMLVALLISRSDFSFKAMLERPCDLRKPSPSAIKRWEKILLTKPDPVVILYKHLVPKWMTVGEFGQVICPLSARPLNGMGALMQQKCITKLHHFFHNKNKKARI